MSDNDLFSIRWIDHEREPQRPPNPAYPNGVDVDLAGPDARNTCTVDLPYPARRCGRYYVECLACGFKAIITTAGRADDPRSTTIPCRHIPDPEDLSA